MAIVAIDTPGVQHSLVVNQLMSWPADVIQQYGSVPDAQAHVTNTLVAAIRQQLPGVEVESLAFRSEPGLPVPDRQGEVERRRRRGRRGRRRPRGTGRWWE